MLRIFMVVMPIILSACSVFGIRSGTEQPPYTILGQLGGVELRHYAARVAAETTIPGDEVQARGAGFRRLAGYIFGGNTTRARIAMTAPVGQSAVGQSAVGQSAGEKIAMTAPVGQSRDAGGWTIRFFMPQDYTLATLPVPDDPQVHLVAVPPQDYAVLRFTGSTGAPAVATRREELLRILSASDWRPTGDALSWFYDPPWTLPWLRRNEVAVPIARASSL